MCASYQALAFRKEVETHLDVGIARQELLVLVFDALGAAFDISERLKDLFRFDMGQIGIYKVAILAYAWNVLTSLVIHLS